VKGRNDRYKTSSCLWLFYGHVKLEKYLSSSASSQFRVATVLNNCFIEQRSVQTFKLETSQQQPASLGCETFVQVKKSL